MPRVQQWARTRVRTSRHVRRGAWYRVLDLSPVEGTLEVNGLPVTLPRAFLLVLPFRPTQWSVVLRLRSSAPPPVSWGPTYGVCPSCNARAPLPRQAVDARCPRCRGLFAIAWTDSGWCAFETLEDGRAVSQTAQLGDRYI
ncbi:MAG TPA: hypothetical protein VM716_10495 [Gemmatimonadales bacterium]|nr:hypothetical protein [Gemmatimonadales bacterium]